MKSSGVDRVKYIGEPIGSPGLIETRHLLIGKDAYVHFICITLMKNKTKTHNFHHVAKAKYKFVHVTKQERTKGK